MALATYADVQDRLLGQTLTVEEQAVVGVRLGDAERLLKAQIPDLVTKAGADPDYHANVVMVEAEAVLRLVRNPEGYLQETDGSYSYMVSQQVASGKLSILDEEWTLLGHRSSVSVISVLPRMPWEPIV